MAWTVIASALVFSSQFLKLLDSEQKLHFQGEPPICTLTWFRGNYQTALQHLQDRQKQAIEHNPWLTGTIARRSGELGVAFHNDSTSVLNDFSVEVIRNSPLSRDTPVQDLYRLVSDHVLISTDDPKEKLWKVAVVPCRTSPEDRFAVVCSLSHVVGDGHVYYTLLESLFSSNQDVPSFDMEPIRDSEVLIQQVIGQAEMDFINSPIQLIKGAIGILDAKLIRPLLRLPNAEQWYLLNCKLLDDCKEDASRTFDVDFLSSNDLLVHWFFTNSGCTLGANLVNYRNRISHHDFSHGRNYWGAIFYNPEDFDNPSLIRASIAHLRRAVTHSLPSWWEFLKDGKIAVASNWRSFSSGSHLPGSEEELHVPVFDFASYCPTNTVVMRTFRANNESIGLYLAGDARMIKGLNGPLGWMKQSMEPVFGRS